MEELLFSITYPPIPITQIGPVALSLHGVFAAVGFYFGANHALKLSEEDLSLIHISEPTRPR